MKRERGHHMLCRIFDPPMEEGQLNSCDCGWECEQQKRAARQRKKLMRLAQVARKGKGAKRKDGMPTELFGYEAEPTT